MRNSAPLVTRVVLGRYLAVHGAQKLFGMSTAPALRRGRGYMATNDQLSSAGTCPR